MLPGLPLPPAASSSLKIRIVQISAACFVDALRPVPLHALAPTRFGKWNRRG
ncbi:hypothetical protein K440DRAFT_621693 [Wilcoxina mikolae CBS 423.85]|nr:hypothetical protein K440DRAFT_621693 [Wilcoxina mikolae CBS 423.85]